MTRTLGLILFFVFSAAPAWTQSIYAPNRIASGGVRIEYTLNVSDPLTHLYDITITVTGLNTDRIDAVMPAWAPGQYAIMDFARNVQGFQAQTSGSQPLAWQKVDKQTWRISKNPAQDVHIRYQVYSTDLDDDLADIPSGTAVFLYIDKQKHVPVTLDVNMPAKWNVYTGLTKSGNRYTAADYDTLADAPLLAGDLKELSFETEARIPYRVVFSNPRLDASAAQVTADLEEVAEEATRLFGGTPFSNYVFLVKIQPGTASAGLGHINSSRIVAGENDFVSQLTYRRFLTNAARSLFQAWVGKRIRPEVLGPFDYSQESYTRLLWFVDGTAAYYADRLLLKTGIYTPEEFLARLSTDIDTLQHQPGRLTTSLEDASWNAWFRSDNNVNTGISWTAKGETAAFLLDLQIRGRSGGSKSLDDVLRYLKTTFADQGNGIPENGIQRAVDIVTGMDFSEFFNDVVRNSQEIDFKSVDDAGLALDVSRQPSTIYFGIEWEVLAGNLVRIRRVLPNSPAQRAKLDIGDVLIAMDSESVTSDNLTSRIHSKRIGKSVALTILRGERLLSLNLLPIEFQEEHWTLAQNFRPTPEQLAIRKSWLGN